MTRRELKKLTLIHPFRPYLKYNMTLMSGEATIYLNSSGWAWSTRAMTMECSPAGLSIWWRPLPLIKIFQLIGFNDTPDLISCSD